MKEMKTLELFALLQTAYPEKSWHLEPYSAKGEQHQAIHLSHEGFGIHNPFESECSRFEKTDRYGLSEEHARLMRRYNSHLMREGLHPFRPAAKRHLGEAVRIGWRGIALGSQSRTRFSRLAVPVAGCIA